MKRLSIYLYILGLVVSPILFLYPQASHAWIDQFNSSASVVIGQSDFVSNLANQGGGSAAANTLNAPLGVDSDGTKIFVSDSLNHRVLIYNTLSASSNTSADVVIGQPNMTSNSANQGGSPAANTLNSLIMAYVYGGKLFIVDRHNHRVLIFNSIPTTNNASADVVIGQPNMTSNSANQGGSVVANTLNSPRAVLFAQNRLFITDAFNHRVLIFNSIPTANNTSADVVIGQPNMTSNNANQGGSPAANTFYAPRGIIEDNGRIFISDIENNRILIYNSIPAINNTSADVVIGQPNMTSNNANQGGSPAANTLNRPHGIYINNNHLFVNDGSNHRFLIFNSLPAANNASADIVIGQADFVSNSANQGGSPGPETLNGPLGATVLSNNLLVADTVNNRILIYKLGPDFLSFSINSGSGSTSSVRVNLNISALGAHQMMISNSADFSGGVWESYATSKEWDLSSGNSIKTVYVKFRDYAQFESDTVSASINVISTTLPQTGGNSLDIWSLFGKSLILLPLLLIFLLKVLSTVFR